MSFQNPLPPGNRQATPDYVSDGVTKAYAFPFRLFSAADLAVYVSANAGESWTPLFFGPDYAVAINGTLSATANLTVAPGAGVWVRLMGQRAPLRATSVINDGVLVSAALENELDALEATLQELRRDIGTLATPSALLTQFFATLPLSPPGSPGRLWNNTGVVNIT